MTPVPFARSWNTTSTWLTMVDPVALNTTTVLDLLEGDIQNRRQGLGPTDDNT